MTAFAAPTFTHGLTAAEARARIRALESGLDFQCERVAPTVWAVPSISHAGERHLVTEQPSGALLCDCLAAQHDRACCHVAAVLLLTERQHPEPASQAPGVPLPAPVPRHRALRRVDLV